jgi:transposase
MLAIGIDMSKATFHAALDELLVRKFKNTTEGIDTFLDAIHTLGHGPGETTIGVESTGVYHLLLATRLTAKGYSVILINPLESHRFIAARTLRRTKTDTVDARAIRAMVLYGVGRLFVETDEVLALKALVTEREGLVEMLRMMKNYREARTVRARAISRTVHDPSPSVMAALESEIHILEAHFLSYAPATQYLLRSIPGIGVISAASLVAHVGDIRRFSSPEKLVAYVGLDCRVHQSGTSVNGRGFVSKHGNRQLRAVLFNAAFRARQANPELKAYFEKKMREGKHYVSALNAVERKLLHIVHAVWTRGTPFEARV